MSISEKTKSINNKIKENKTQSDLEKQTAKISVLFSGNVSKYKFLTFKDISPEKYSLGRVLQWKDLNLFH